MFNPFGIRGKMKNDPIDWDEPPLAGWLRPITKNSTKTIYKCGFRLYAAFMGMTATQLVDEALEDQIAREIKVLNYAHCKYILLRYIYIKSW